MPQTGDETRRRAHRGLAPPRGPMPRPDEVHRHHRPSSVHRGSCLLSRRGHLQSGQALRRRVQLILGQVARHGRRAHQKPRHEQRHRRRAQRRPGGERRRGGALGDPQPVQALDIGFREAVGYVHKTMRDFCGAVPVEHVTPQPHQERGHLLTRQIVVGAEPAVGLAFREAQNSSTQNMSRPVTIRNHITELRDLRRVTQFRRGLYHSPIILHTVNLRRDMC